MNDNLEACDGRGLRLEHLDQQRIVVLSSVASPPGSLIDVQCSHGKFKIKVHNCRKVAEQELGFRIEGRPVNLGKSAREALIPTS